MIKPRKFTSTLLSIEELNPKLRLFTFSAPEGFKFNAGQYVMAMIPAQGNLLKRQYSIANPPNQANHIHLAITKVQDGAGSNYFFDLKPKSKVDFMGPMGLFTIRQGELEQGATFISTGTGIVPFHSMIKELLSQKCKSKLTLIAGYRHEKDVLFEKEFKDLAVNCKNFNYYQILSKPQNPNYKGFKGHVEVLVHHNWDQINGDTFYLCGLKEMVEETRNLLQNKGIPKPQIRMERYD